jgi:hypothetical protein
MSSELELLRQHIGELKAKNAKLEAEKAELLKQVMEKDPSVMLRILNSSLESGSLRSDSQYWNRVLLK